MGNERSERFLAERTLRIARPSVRTLAADSVVHAPTAARDGTPSGIEDGLEIAPTVFCERADNELHVFRRLTAWAKRQNAACRGLSA